MKEHRLICPDPDPAGSEVSEHVSALAKAWREGEASQISALADLLSDASALPDLFKITPGGPTYRFLTDFLRYVREAPGRPGAWLERVKEGRGLGEIPVSVAGFGSATGALTAALSAAGAAGGEVVTSSLNYVGVINAIAASGAVPRFVDIDPSTWCMDADAAARAVTGKTRAIILTHLNIFADIWPYEELFHRRGFDFPLIQDASLAIASTREGARPGLVNVGPNGLTVMSLTVSKIFSGMGGAVATSHDQGILEVMHEIAHQGVSQSNPGELSFFGMNCKMSAINAAIAHAQLRRREEIVSRRRRLRAAYEKSLAPLVREGMVSLQELGEETVPTHFGVVLPLERKEVSTSLQQRFNVQTGLWHAHHLQKLYRILLGNSRTRLPATEKLANGLLFLPFHTALTEDDVKFICSSLSSVISGSASPSRRRVSPKAAAHPRVKTQPSKGRPPRRR